MESIEANDSCLGAGAFQRQYSHRARERKPARAGASGIEQQSLLDHMLIGTMRVSKNNHLWLRLLDHLPVAIAKLMQLAKDMSDDNPMSGEFFHTLNGKSVEAIIVPFDRKHWSDLLQSVDHFKLPDISRMNNCVNASEDRRDRLVEDSVSV